MSVLERPVTPVETRSSDVPVLLHQIKFEQLTFWRNPQAMIFTFIFPVTTIAIFGALFRDNTSSEFFGGQSSMEYYTPTIIALSVLGACYSQLAIVLSMRRQTGVLKRLHATPLPAWIYFTGLLVHCVVVSAVNVVLVISVGALYGVPLPADWSSLGISLVVGAACFCALGAAVASLVGNAEAAPAVVQFAQLPLVIVSGTYFPIHSEFINRIAGFFPVKPLNDAIAVSFSGGGVPWTHLGVLAAWAAVASVVAVRRFRWEPRRT